MAKQVTTIYIDDSGIWLLIARGRQVRKWASMPLPPSLVRSGVILDQDAVANRVKELWRSQRIGTSRRKRKVVAGISGINCLHHLLRLPEIPRDLLPEAVKREADRVLGVHVEQLYLYWQALPSVAGEMVVYLTASLRNSVDALIKTLKKAGLRPYLADLKPLALARTSTEPSAIIIDVQPASFDIVIVTEGIPQVIRSVPLTQDTLPDGKVSLVSEELNRAVTFYNSSHADKPIDTSIPLLVSGELAQQQDTWRILIGKRECPVRTLCPPMRAPEGFPSNQYATNIGLALKEVLTSEKGAIAYSQVSFNALPEAYIPKPRSVAEILLMPTIIVSIGLLAFSFSFNTNASAYTSAVRAELATVNQMTLSQRVRAEDIVSLSKDVSALAKQVSSVEATANAFRTTLADLAAGRDKVNSDLAAIIGLLPAAVDLQGVNYTSDSITVQGSAEAMDDVVTYARDLRASGRFALVSISETRQETAGIGFTLSLVK